MLLHQMSAGPDISVFRANSKNGALNKFLQKEKYKIGE